MPSPFADLAHRFAFDERMLDAAVAGFSDADGRARPAPDVGNSAHWILAHVAAMRRHLARRLGVAVPTAAWEASVARGVPAGDVRDADPTALLADLRDRGGEVRARLAALLPTEAAAPFGVRTPDGSTTVADVARFLQLHEAYHLGQLGLIRWLRGHPGFA